MPLYLVSLLIYDWVITHDSLAAALCPDISDPTCNEALVVRVTCSLKVAGHREISEPVSNRASLIRQYAQRSERNPVRANGLFPSLLDDLLQLALAKTISEMTKYYCSGFTSNVVMYLVDYNVCKDISRYHHDVI